MHSTHTGAKFLGNNRSTMKFKKVIAQCMQNIKQKRFQKHSKLNTRLSELI